MKPRYKINEIVRIKATGEKVKIVEIFSVTDGYWYWTEDDRSFFEPNLKPYRPSRTGKYRDSHGRFIQGWMLRKPEDVVKDMSDSKQNNYQKELESDGLAIIFKDIQNTMKRIEKKINELGRRV